MYGRAEESAESGAGPGEDREEARGHTAIRGSYVNRALPHTIRQCAVYLIILWCNGTAQLARAWTAVLPRTGRKLGGAPGREPWARRLSNRDSPDPRNYTINRNLTTFSGRETAVMLAMLP